MGRIVLGHWNSFCIQLNANPWVSSPHDLRFFAVLGKGILWNPELVHPNHVQRTKRFKLFGWWTVMNHGTKTLYDWCCHFLALRGVEMFVGQWWFLLSAAGDVGSILGRDVVCFQRQKKLDLLEVFQEPYHYIYMYPTKTQQESNKIPSGKPT